MPEPDTITETARELSRRDGEDDVAWIARLREHFAAERRDEIRRDAERWADADRQP